MASWNSLRGPAAAIALGLVCLAGCSKPPVPGDAPAGGTAPTAPVTAPAAPAKPAAPVATAKPEDVKAVRDRIAALKGAKCEPVEGDLVTTIIIPDGAPLTAEDIALFGKLTDLTKLQIFNCRTLNDEMAATLTNLKGLTSLAITNSAITDATVESIVKTYPKLTDLDLSSNTNMSNKIIKIISEQPLLQRLTLVQNRVNDIGAQRLSLLTSLRALDMRGNMEAGDMALDVVAGLPKLAAFKHRSTAVSDSGMESLSRNQTLDSLLIQDFNITDQSGPSLAKLSKLTQLEVFRCQGFGSQGVLALKGMGLTRLTLRDLPNVYDDALEIFTDMPKLKRLYLHELSSLSDSGLKNLGSLQSLEVLDIWAIQQMTDATVDVIATLPKLKELTIRDTGVTDASIDKILAMPSLQSLTFKDNASVTEEGKKRLSGKKWAKLDLGSSGNADSGDQ